MIATWNIFCILEPAGGIYTAGRAARALGCAGPTEGAHYPAGTRGDIQAVTLIGRPVFKGLYYNIDNNHM